MKKSTYAWLAVVLVVIIALVVWVNRTPKTEVTKSGEITNGQMLNTSNAAITTESDVAYFRSAKGYFARPKAEGVYPGIVMIHENKGLRPETKVAADNLAKEGYMVLAVDLLGGTAEDQDGAKALTSKFSQVTGVENMQAAVDFLESKGVTKIASLGWCFGGKQSVELSVSGQKLDATVVYYGGGMATTTERLSSIKWPVLGIFGDKDTAVPVETVRAFENSLNSLNIENEIYIYPGVGHAFANPSGMNYAPNETKDAWAKTVAFLNRHLK